MDPTTTPPSNEDLDHRNALLGIVTTLAVAVPVLVAQVSGTATDLVKQPSAWWIAYLVFVATLVASVNEWPRPWPQGQHRIALLVLTTSGLAAVALSPAYGFSVVLPIVTATAASYVIGFRPALGLVVFQAAVILLVYLATPQVRTGEAILQGVAWGGFMGFAVFTVEAEARQSRARERLAVLNDELASTNAELARSNAELEEAQRQLAATSRNAERLRISRDLHDLMGHQLTALTLQLETASHLGVGPATDNVDRARTIARDLLGDVREVVGQLRLDATPDAAPRPATRPGDARDDLARQLRESAAAVVSLRVALDLDESVLPDDADRATAVLRVVQEAITNTARHADADHLWIAVAAQGDDLVVTAHDDGRGATMLEPGNGLVGMRERLATVGGTLATWTPSDDGLHLEARIPLRKRP